MRNGRLTWYNALQDRYTCGVVRTSFCQNLDRLSGAFSLVLIRIQERPPGIAPLVHGLVPCTIRENVVALLRRVAPVAAQSLALVLDPRVGFEGRSLHRVAGF